MTDDTTARLALPLLQPGQAQKELWHNEALALIDLALPASVLAVGAATPPATPDPGDAWVIGAAPTGDWAGQANALAGWTAGGWRFLPPAEGMAVWSVADAVAWRFSDGAWLAGELRGRRVLVEGTPVVGPQRAAVPDAAGGTVVDTEARAALAAILAALRGHGLIAP